MDALDVEDVVQLVSLLAAGLTDAAIARRLGWSDRTVRRRVARLFKDIGAKNRFQAGFLLAKQLGPTLPQPDPGYGLTYEK